MSKGEQKFPLKELWKSSKTKTNFVAGNEWGQAKVESIWVFI